MLNEALAVAPATSAFDVYAERAKLPILSWLVGYKPLVNFDNGASAQKPQVVLDAVMTANVDSYSNGRRGGHFLSSESVEIFVKAIRRVMELFA